MLKKGIVLLFCTFLGLHAQFVDDDMDGVANEDDLCPNSALTDIVDAKGCAIDKVAFKKEHHFDLTLGYSYSRFDSDTSQHSQSLSLGYYYGNFSAYFYTYNYDLQNGESGIADSTLAVYYRQIDGQIAFKFGAGLYIPTSDALENKTDTFLSTKLTYYYQKYDFTLNFQHTFMNDTNTVDTDRLAVSIGYVLSENTYISLSYSSQNSIYENEGDIDTVALYGSYYIDKHWFVSNEISLGLSESATDLYYIFNIGYYF